MHKRPKVLILAHGHSGTRALARVLEKAGLYMGRGKRNQWYDNTGWITHFMVPMVNQYFKWGEGCKSLCASHAKTMAEEKMKHYLKGVDGEWSFKHCLGAFAYEAYKAAFGDVKVIYMIRDGRDVVLSSTKTDGQFYLTGSHKHGDRKFYETTTFGISNDMDECPFKYPEEMHELKNRYWIQAKAWTEHHKMVQYLIDNNILSAKNCFVLHYESLCKETADVVQSLLKFLNLSMTPELDYFVKDGFTTDRINKWKKSDYSFEFEEVFQIMNEALESAGYGT